jgi:VanZ like protein
MHARTRSARGSYLNLSPLTIMWLMFVATLSLLPLHIKHSIGTTGVFHTWGHIGIFGITGATCCRRVQQEAANLIGGMIVLLFAVSLECLQWSIYGNRFEWRDVLSDALGIACGLLLLAITRRDVRLNAEQGVSGVQ